MRLPASLRYSVYAAIAALLGSGVLWLFLRYTAFAPQAWASLSMRVHGAAGMVILPLVGGAAALHAGAAWRDRKNRISGFVLSCALVVLTLTGYCLYYVGGESLRNFASVTHWVIGMALPLVLAFHATIGRNATSPRDVAITPDENPENATAASAMRR
jgi:hypothetical protein